MLMAKGVTSRRGAWISGAAFVTFSGAVALGWTQGIDLWMLQTVQGYSSRSLDAVLAFFALPGGPEVSVAVLLVGLFLRGHRAFAGRILAAFVATGLLELLLKLYLPQTPIPRDAVLAEDYAPLLTVLFPYPYPSGHMLRSVILLGALCLLSENRLLRALLLVVLAGVAANRVYFGTHWPSDVVGGALLGFVGLLWAFKD